MEELQAMEDRTDEYCEEKLKQVAVLNIGATSCMLLFALKFVLHRFWSSFASRGRYLLCERVFRRKCKRESTPEQMISCAERFR